MAEGGSPSEGSGTAPAPGEGNKAPKRGTGWLNLQTYVDANRGNNLADSVKRAVTKEGREIEEAMTGFRDTARNRIRENTVEDDGIVDSIRTSPNTITADEARKKRFYDQYNASYQGPESVEDLDDYRTVNARLDELNRKLEASKSQEGRVGLVEEQFGRDGYSSGEKRLDAFLLGSDQDLLGQLAQDRDHLSSSWDRLTRDIGTDIQRARETTDTTRKRTRDALDSSLSDFNAYIEQLKGKAAARAADYQRKFDDTRLMLTSQDPNIRRAGYQAIGVDPELGEWLQARGVSAADLITKQADFKLGDFARDEDQQRYQALMELAGRRGDLDFAKSGTSSWYGRNEDAFSSASDAMSFQEAVKQRVERANRNRQEHYDAAVGRLLAGDTWIPGLSEEAFASARKYGVNPIAFLKKGSTVDTGDVLNEAERQRWADLKATLGIQDDFKVMDTQDEGKAWDFDVGAFLNAVAAATPPPPPPPPPRELQVPIGVAPAGTLAVNSGATKTITAPPPRPLTPEEQESAKRTKEQHDYLSSMPAGALGIFTGY